MLQAGEDLEEDEDEMGHVLDEEEGLLNDGDVVGSSSPAESGIHSYPVRRAKAAEHRELGKVHDVSERAPLLSRGVSKRSLSRRRRMSSV